MCLWVMLGEVIHSVSVAQSPKDVVLALAYPISYPVKLHINRLGAFLLDVVIAILVAVVVLV